MVRTSGLRRPAQAQAPPMTANAPDVQSQLLGMSPFMRAFDLNQNRSPSVGGITIGNAERPSNLWYKVTGQSTYWYMYALMDWYKSEVSVLSTIINRSTQELFRHGLELRPKFAYKCVDCGHESDFIIKECPVCGSRHLRRPDPTQKDYFVRPNGKSFLEEANDNGQTLNMRGEGEAGLRGGPAGDLYITITVKPHKLFTRRGTDLYLDMNIPMTVAALGGEIQVPTLRGTVKYTVPEGTQPGTTFRLKEQGMPRLNSNSKGDLLVRTNVTIPKRLSDEQRDLMKRLAVSLGDKISDARPAKKNIFSKIKDAMD